MDSTLDKTEFDRRCVGDGAERASVFPVYSFLLTVRCCQCMQRQRAGGQADVESHRECSGRPSRNDAAEARPVPYALELGLFCMRVTNHPDHATAVSLIIIRWKGRERKG